MPLTAPEPETLAWLALLRTPGLGPVRIRQLLERFGDARSAHAAPALEWQRLGLPREASAARIAATREALAHDLAWLEAPHHFLIPCDHADYPALLARSPQAPAALFVAGDPDLLWHPQIAVVGSRNPSEGGRDNARDFARTLARAGFAITSGLADGIDAAAHRAALDIGGKTIAVIGTGPDLVYPAKHRALSAQIETHGTIVSEFPPGTEARREHFPRRNAVIAGLSLGTLVVEAAIQSGALITARLAAEAGREVFALPGSIHNPLAKGCHRLIREGAALVETAQDIVAALEPAAAQLASALRSRLNGIESGDAEGAAPALGPGDDPDYQRLWRALGHDPVGIDVLASRSGLTVEVLSSMLLLMELDGRVAAAHGRYSKRRS
jgi:DNA processing protein